MAASKNMKIGIDISQLVFVGTGVARFTRGLVNAICDFDLENEWTFFFSSLRLSCPADIENKIKQKNQELKKFKIPPSMLSLLWNKLHYFNLERFIGKLDWFISSDWTEPPTSSVKKATVVHDLVYLRYPETVDSKILNTQKKRLSLVKKESKIIFADSNQTKDDLENLLHIDRERIHVNYPGVDIMPSSKKQINDVLSKFKLEKPFILTVSKIEPRKNLKSLIDAFSKLNKNDITLIIVGPKGWNKLDDDELTQLINQLSSKVKFLGYVSDQDLASLYASCLFFIYPSIWEGFGYPVIEAMKIGSAVATSDTSSLKEIADGTTLLFDPFNVEDMKSKMQKLIDDEKLRKTLINEGKKRVELFTWKNYINKLTQTLYDYRY